MCRQKWEALGTCFLNNARRIFRSKIQHDRRAEGRILGSVRAEYRKDGGKRIPLVFQADNQKIAIVRCSGEAGGDDLSTVSDCDRLQPVPVTIDVEGHLAADFVGHDAAAVKGRIQFTALGGNGNGALCAPISTQ
jgi:hypothetical protein